jgi:hypothetical protein
MLSSRDTQWSSALYYDMPLIPILFAAAADGFRRVGSLVDRARGLGKDPDPQIPAPQAPADAPRIPSDTPKRPWWQPRTAMILAMIAAPVFVGFAVHDIDRFDVVRWYNGTAAPFRNADVVDQANQALAKVPPGVTVRATNNLVIPLLATNEVTLIGSNVDEGDWAILDTGNPSCPIGPKEIPLIMKQLDQMGFRPVFATPKNRMIVMQRTAPAVRPITGTGTSS